MGRKLYVGNLPYTAAEQDLQELFEKVGPVESVTVMRDMATGRARGFGFVEMGTDEGAQKAITELHESQLGGRTLTVNEARPKEARGGGGFGGGGGGRGGGGFGGGGGGRGGNGGGGGGGGRREPRW
ncbi:MAG: RNA-binding protein [Acidobacteriota bacterium]|nr:RNA-binding protein [Acidobacteriota bacterium]MDP2318016.1 RNA-binding protein [Acidobacteriota bacterium]MDP3716324.1 RNA-binding protein [Acidobacteriota bacterium]